MKKTQSTFMRSTNHLSLTNLPAISTQRTRILSDKEQTGINLERRNSSYLLETQNSLKKISFLSKKNKLRQQYPQLEKLQLKLERIPQTILTQSRRRESQRKNTTMLKPRPDSGVSIMLKGHLTQNEQNFSLISAITLKVEQEQSRVLRIKKYVKEMPKNQADLPSNQYLKPDHLVRFQQFPLKFSNYTSVQKELTNVKNIFDQSVKQSSNLITRRVLREYQGLVLGFRKVEANLKKEFLFQLIDNRLDDDDQQKLSYINDLSVQSASVEDQIDYLIRILQNKIENQVNSYDEIKQMFTLITKNISTTRSVNFYFQICYIFSVFSEAFGQLSKAQHEIHSLIYFCNIYQIHEIKVYLYYRIGCSLNRQTLYEKALVQSKKLLKLCWYFNNIEYELHCYYILAKAFLGLKMLKEAHVFYERYINSKVQEDGYIKSLGIKYTKAYIANKQNASNRHSPSTDEFDLDLLVNEDTKNVTVQLKKPNYSQQIMKHVEKKHFKFPQGQAQIVLNHQSYNRNFVNFFSEKSEATRFNNQMQQLFKPSQSVPLLVRLLLIFKKNYLTKYTEQNIPLKMQSSLSIIYNSLDCLDQEQDIQTQFKEF